jgi:hypothetical protein
MGSMRALVAMALACCVGLASTLAFPSDVQYPELQAKEATADKQKSDRVADVPAPQKEQPTPAKHPEKASQQEESRVEMCSTEDFFAWAACFVGNDGTARATWILVCVVLAQLLWMIRQERGLNASLAVSDKAASAAKDALEVSRRNQILTHRPRLIITNVAIWDAADPKKPPPNMTPGARIDGIAFAVNIGAADAIADGNEKNFCYIEWLPDRLPMLRPYGNRLRDLRDFFVDGEGRPVERLKPGEHAHWNFSTTVPADYTAASLHLYVFGAVFYRDELGTRHARLFARRYRTGLEQFEVMRDYPDYESEE